MCVPYCKQGIIQEQPHRAARALVLPLNTFRTEERCVVSPGAVWRAYDAFMPCAKNRTVFMLLFLAVSKRSSSGSRLTLPTTPDPT